jgi:hypothetical protein
MSKRQPSQRNQTSPDFAKVIDLAEVVLAIQRGAPDEVARRESSEAELAREEMKHKCKLALQIGSCAVHDLKESVRKLVDDFYDRKFLPAFIELVKSISQRNVVAKRSGESALDNINIVIVDSPETYVSGGMNRGGGGSLSEDLLPSGVHKFHREDTTRQLASLLKTMMSSSDKVAQGALNNFALWYFLDSTNNVVLTPKARLAPPVIIDPEKNSMWIVSNNAALDLRGSRDNTLYLKLKCPDREPIRALIGILCLNEIANRLHKAQLSVAPPAIEITPWYDHGEGMYDNSSFGYRAEGTIQVALGCSEE